LRQWSWVHTWSSLICTVFMLLLCATGLPLIFHHEIGHLTGTEVRGPELPRDTPPADLDLVRDTAMKAHPGMVPQFMLQESDDDTQWLLTLNRSVDARKHPASAIVDARTAQLLGQPRYDEGFMYVMLKLHIDLFAGTPGRLFLGAMGLLMVVAVVSGAVLYAPFARKSAFGTVRGKPGELTRWLDLHNVLGVVTLVWSFTVAATGVINALSELVLDHWKSDQLAALMAPYMDQPPAESAGSLQAAMAAARASSPGMRPAIVAFPGTEYATPHHYSVFMRGDTPLTARLLKPVLVDARTATVAASAEAPWYLNALLISQPLHFGDYASMPMKILWATMDVICIVILWSGLVLWWRRRSFARGSNPVVAGAPAP
jgi:uncharacterized iron-regulated membrane protein